MLSPDRSFVRELRNIDRRLGVKWNGLHFVITYNRGYGEPVNILQIKAENGAFRQPDQRDLIRLREGDLASGETMDARLRRLSYISEQARDRLREKTRTDIRDMTKDNKNQLQRAFREVANTGGKANSAFRRITPKPKTQTIGAGA